MAQSGTSKQPVKREGPNITHQMLSTIRDAVAAGVPSQQLLPLIDMALSAKGVQQAPGFRMVMDAMQNATKAAQGPAV